MKDIYNGRPMLCEILFKNVASTFVAFFFGFVVFAYKYDDLGIEDMAMEIRVMGQDKWGGGESQRRQV
jgi:hypothetical protein